MNLFKKLKLDPADAKIVKGLVDQDLAVHAADIKKRVWKLSYLDIDNDGKSKVVGEWFYETFDDILDSLWFDNDDEFVPNSIVITKIR